MCDCRLPNLFLLYVCVHKTDALNLKKIASYKQPQNEISAPLAKIFLSTPLQQDFYMYFFLTTPTRLINFISYTLPRSNTRTTNIYLDVNGSPVYMYESLNQELFFFQICMQCLCYQPCPGSTYIYMYIHATYQLVTKMNCNSRAAKHAYLPVILWKQHKLYRLMVFCL